MPKRIRQPLTFEKVLYSGSIIDFSSGLTFSKCAAECKAGGQYAQLDQPFVLATLNANTVISDIYNLANNLN